jgi:hypothetical protein
MTLVLCDQEIASRDCEIGGLGAFWMSYLAQVLVVIAAVESSGSGVQKVSKWMVYF